jgi:hypothetical protein
MTRPMRVGELLPAYLDDLERRWVEHALTVDKCMRMRYTSLIKQQREEPVMLQQSVSLQSTIGATKIPNSKLQEAFYKVCTADENRTFEDLMQKGNLGSATAFVTRVVIDNTLYPLLDREHLLKAKEEEEFGPSIYDFPEMLR